MKQHNSMMHLKVLIYHIMQYQLKHINGNGTDDKKMKYWVKVHNGVCVRKLSYDNAAISRLLILGIATTTKYC